MLRRIARHESEGGGEVHSNAQHTLDEMARLKSGRELPRGVLAAPPASGRRRRNVYDARHGESLPGKLVLTEGGVRPKDVSVLEAYDGVGRTLEFFRLIFGRNSIDGRGTPLDATVHYSLRFDNALWNGIQLIFGDGDDRFFNRFTIAQDVISHELGHAFTDSTAGLVYRGQSGAINEHISDVIGIMVKQFILGLLAEQSDWYIGAGLFMPRVKGYAIRSMAAPGTAYDDPILGRDPQPAHMRDYVVTREDNGGVHINSGILNHAFYLAATAIGGRVWLILGKVWIQTVMSDITRTTTLQQFADATTERAVILYGPDSHIPTVIADAWSEVGLAPRRSFARRRFH
jgi:Zn-dependent metalloprotease